MDISTGKEQGPEMTVRWSPEGTGSSVQPHSASSLGSQGTFLLSLRAMQARIAAQATNREGCNLHSQMLLIHQER